MLQKRSLIHCYIPSKFIWLLSLENFISFSLRIKIIQSNSGSVLADVINLSTKSSTKRPSRSIPSPYSLANCLGIIVRRSNAMTLPIDGKWFSKHQMQKKSNFWISLTVTTISLNYHISKVVCSLDILVTLTLCM